MAISCQILVIFLVSTTCLARLTLDTHNDDPYPERDAPVRLTCYDHTDVILSENPTDGKIVWIKDGQELAKWPVSLDSPNIQADCPFSVSGVQYQDSSSSFFAYLDISSMDATCNGLYSCRLDDSEGSVVSRSVEKSLTMKWHPSSEYPSCSLHSIRDEQALICTSETGAPPVSLQWWKYGQPLEQTESTDDFVQARWSVTGDESTLGRFDCCLTYAGVQSGCCTLDSPTVAIHSNRPTTNVNVGENISFRCIASGNPPATVTWDKSHIYAPSQEKDYELHVSNITLQDNGSLVICNAQNAMGSSQASSMMTVKPLELVIELVQIKTPESTNGLAQFKCTIKPVRSTHYIWQYDGLYVDPLNMSDRFVIERGNTLSVLQVSVVDIGASVMCRVTAGNHLTAVVHMNASFPLPIPTEQEKTFVDDFLGLGLDSLLGYIVSGVICVLLIAICCWVSLKAKSLCCAKKGSESEEHNETRGKSPNNNSRHELENLVVDIASYPQPQSPLCPVSKQLLVEQEATYQDLEDVSRQINDYQRLISNDWTPRPLNTQL